MSIRKIPDRYLDTDLYIFRGTTAIDSVGDQDVSLALAYTALKANIQPKESDVGFQLQGRIEKQTHVARINRVETDTVREIEPGDIALDEETGERYYVLGIEVWQAADRSLTDTHHITLNLKTSTGLFDGLVEFETIGAKGRIAA